MQKQGLDLTNFNPSSSSLTGVLAGVGLSGSEPVYTQLLKSEPLPVGLFATLLHVQAEKAEQLIASYAVLDDQGRVVGFMGLSLVPTAHKLIVKGKIFYAWDAAAAIMLPQLLYFSALIESLDPVSGQPVPLSVNENFLEWTDPVPLFIGWMAADSHPVQVGFRPPAQFFASEASAEQWRAGNASANVANVDTFFTYVRGGRGCC